MTNYDHIHDDNVVPLFEDILIRRRRRRQAMARLHGLSARLRHACGRALVWRRAR
jgi:hypothetical protein